MNRFDENKPGLLKQEFVSYIVKEGSVYRIKEERTFDEISYSDSIETELLYTVKKSSESDV